MNILYYIDTLHMGGAENLCVNYLIKLKELGNACGIVVNSKEKTFLEQKLIDNDIKIYYLFEKRNLFSKIINRTKLGLNFYLKNKWKNIINDYKPDVIHVNTCLKYFSFVSGCKIFFSFHTDIDRYFSLWKENTKTMAKYIKKGMKLIAISSKIKEDIAKLFHIDSYLVHNGVDIDWISNNKYSREDVLKEYNVPTDAFIIANVGRFHSVKNHQRVLSIFSDLIKIKNNSYLFLVGSGSVLEKKNIIEMIKKYNLEKKVIIVESRNDAALMMNAFDVFLLPSIKEGFSLVTIEAQSVGLKVVSSLAIPKEVVINKNVHRISLEEENCVWIEEILKNEDKTIDDKLYNYSLEASVNSLIEIYNK